MRELRKHVNQLQATSRQLEDSGRTKRQGGVCICAHQMEGANGKVDGAAAAVTVIDGEEGLVWIAVEAVDRNQLVLATNAHILYRTSNGSRGSVRI